MKGKKNILNEIADFDAIEQEEVFTSEHLVQRALRKRELEELILREEIHWRQKVRVKWVKEGDCNLKFFHKVANGRRNGKFIKTLENERGLVLNNSESITEEILLYFEKLYLSLTGSLGELKIIAKVLSGRLRGVLHETIHSTQGAFVQGRQILDAILIVNEIVDEKRRSGEKGVVFKIDFEKVYDHVSWDFLDHVLEKKGFSPRWRKLMKGCLSTVSFPVLVNGNAKGWVKASRGLRQDDPLSIFLFILVADVLSRMLLRADERNSLEGFRVGRNKIRVSHLQFADDTIFFSNTCEEVLQTLKSLLLVFGHISGLKVNLDKSNIYDINLEQNQLSKLAELLDCKASVWPILYLGLPLGLVRKYCRLSRNQLSKLAELLDCKASVWPILYLGLPLGGNPKACGFWDPVIVRILRRLDGRQKVYLSFGGRITLIQSYLTHMPSYFLSLVKIPASVAGKLTDCKGIFYGRGLGKEMGKEFGSGKTFGGVSNLWDPNIQDYLEDLEGLMRSLDCLHLSPSVLDARSWSLSTSGIFTVKSFFLALSQFSGSPPVIPTKFVWNSQVPFKVKSFVWLVAHKKVNTNDLLQLRRLYKALSPDIFQKEDRFGNSRSVSWQCQYRGITGLHCWDDPFYSKFFASDIFVKKLIFVQESD
ncbi:LINE-1 retrotransposable element ORF2 protein [Vitis vinifera]|uniref:LINE-1 retrotransposable element ORF2 protein n=1 Tax=Vitis vinifera TaxID=29760 RepID=A0A438FZM0_VITVI|nr:LINE-1 retrotransposable element ORF2 protein [Vitis vinifera]